MRTTCNCGRRGPHKDKVKDNGIGIGCSLAFFDTPNAMILPHSACRTFAHLAANAQCPFSWKCTIERTWTISIMSLQDLQSPRSSPNLVCHDSFTRRNPSLTRPPNVQAAKRSNIKCFPFSIPVPSLHESRRFFTRPSCPIPNFWAGSRMSFQSCCSCTLVVIIGVYGTFLVQYLPSSPTYGVFLLCGVAEQRPPTLNSTSNMAMWSASVQTASAYQCQTSYQVFMVLARVLSRRVPTLHLIDHLRETDWKNSQTSISRGRTWSTAVV